MATAGEWIGGARPRTLGAAVSPVLVGTAAASVVQPVLWGRAAAALVVAVALQVGVNYANDYSDGVRGTDAARRGPVRLTATGLATPAAVRNASVASFVVAALVGGILSLVVNPWLLLIGVASIAAGALYTGGPRPYGYSGLGEVMVLVFFGFVATCGSTYVQIERLTAVSLWGSLVVGLPACGILLANNLRDADTDRLAGKRTVVVRLGKPVARRLYLLCIAGSFASVIAIGAQHPWALLGLLALPLAVRPSALVLHRDDPPSLVAALTGTALLEIVVAVLVTLGLALS
jgi:1,4-dihydroxy-2-naphthoate polyprenyltransferase